MDIISWIFYGFSILPYKPSTLRIAMMFFWGANPEKNEKIGPRRGGTSMVPIWILGEHPLDFQSLIGSYFIEIKL